MKEIADCSWVRLLVRTDENDFSDGQASVQSILFALKTVVLSNNLRRKGNFATEVANARDFKNQGGIL